MVRGFTLLEVLITVVIVTVITVMLVPNYLHMQQSSEMKRLADELQHFVHTAKSRAILRNQNLWAHYIAPASGAASSNWRLILTESDAFISSAVPLLVMSGQSYRHLAITFDYTSDQIKFDGLRGRLKPGNLVFYPLVAVSQSLKLKTSYGAGRVIICAPSGARYDFPSC
ncbi:GspH/FimT family pseudopilin [Vibrio sp.]|uniref:GspH/FimT family pseudopilin n=1 Tax=Vibrio sp. TaxID=678 RepID=UPI003D0F7FE7